MNSSYPLELIAYRQIGDLIHELLQADARKPSHIMIEVCEYTNEAHLAQSHPLPPCNVLINLNHDWPTIHEDPVWAAQWLRLLSQAPACVPSKEQILWLFEKTRYVEEVITVDSTMMLPTIIVRNIEDVAVAVEQFTSETGSRRRTFVCKENFSAGKEGVSFVQWKTKNDAKRKMEKLMKTVGVCSSGSSTKKRSRSITLQQKQAVQDEQDSMAYVDQSFVGGNKGVFMVQQFEPRFSIEHEKRLFYSKGTFLYAMSYKGWIGQNAQPKQVTDKDLAVEKEKVRRLLELLPRLSLYPLVRFDFGPGALLSEVEVLPDLFGGPDGNMTGEKWENVRRRIAEAYVEDIVEQLGWNQNRK